MPKSGKNPKKNGDEPKKRGNPGDFRGRRLEFLRSRTEELCKRSAAGMTRKWWKDVWAEYWQEFPWTLAINEEPPEDMSTYPMKSDSELTAEELALKKKTMDDTQAKLKRWFSYARTSRGASNPFARWISQLRRVDEQAPRRLVLYQSYMQDEEALVKINNRFKAEYPDLVGVKNCIKERAQIARELLAEETEEYREALKEKAEEEYEEAVEEYKSGEGAAVGEVKDAELQKESVFPGYVNHTAMLTITPRARQRLAVTVQPLLDALRALTGSHILLMTGKVIDGRFDVRTMQADLPVVEGVDQELHLSAWDPMGFKKGMNEILDGGRKAAEPNAEGPLTPLASKEDAPVVPSEAAATDAAKESMPVADAGVNEQGENEGEGVGKRRSTRKKRDAGEKRDASKKPDASKKRGGKRSAGDGDGAGDGTGDGAGDDGASEDDWEEGDWEEDVNDVEARLDALPLVKSPLRRQVRAMTPNSQANRLRQLEGGNTLYLTRESNIAWSQEQLEKLGLKESVSSLMAEVRAANKRKHDDGDGADGPSGKRRRKGADDDGYEDGSDDGGSEGDGEASGSVKDQGVARRRAGENPLQRVDGVPNWASYSKSQLVCAELGELWGKVVDLWWKREVSADFDGPAKGLKTKQRPSEVKGWIQRKRVGGPQPSITDVFGFSVTWWMWWVAMNPEWRTRLNNGRRLSRADETEGDWSELRAQTGPNGLLNVLICLRWWKAAERVVECGDWNEAVEDVLWVLQKLESSVAATGA
ncbi:hypothetical protein R3P38DRAFT_2759634 [Favolaschia claudopus]|uniref:Uncharacterized protein n=1 Tax=Favolaschia claudopus TaxID=2862362 RepID=A0AAW0DW82_9AGAR